MLTNYSARNHILKVRQLTLDTLDNMDTLVRLGSIPLGNIAIQSILAIQLTSTQRNPLEVRVAKL